MSASSVPFFSVVIPCLNEQKFLPRLLRDLSKQTFTNFEVLVVDGHSDDKTVEKAESYTDRLNIKVFVVAERNVSFQRNAGGNHAVGDWIIFMDADNRLPPYFLEGVKYQLSKYPDVDLFSTRLEVDSTRHIDKLIENSINLDIELSTSVGNTKSMGALIGVKRHILRKHKFDVRQKYMEDSMFVKQLCESGYEFKIFKDPKFVYSLRRIKKVGNMRMFQAMVKYQIRYLMGGDFSQPFSAELYPMLGGSYYEKNTPKGATWLTNIQHFIKTASQKQLEQARSILKTIKESEY